MGIPEMSLINKMLQDLEGRRLEGDAVGALNGQVRAAPEPNKIHAAWWVVLGLTLILTGLVSWLWGYRTAPVAMPGEQPVQLALKLAPNIQMPQPPIPKLSAAEEKIDIVPVLAPTVIPTANEDRTDNASNATAGNRDQNSVAGAPPVPVSRQVPASTATPVTVPAPLPVNAATAQAPAVAAPRVQAPETAAARIVDGRTAPTVASKSIAVDRPLQKTDRETEFDIPANVSKQVKELTPQQRAEEEYRRAMVLLDQGKNSESMAGLEKSLQLDPQHGVARQTLAGLLLEAKRPDEAIRQLQNGLNIDKGQPALAMMLARLQVDKGELRPAVETLQRTLPYAVERADYQAFLAALLQREGRHKEASEHYLLALRKSPQNGLWWMGIAISLQADNRPGEARDAFGRAKASSNLSPELLAFVDEKLKQLR